MTTNQTAPRNIDEYIAGFPPDVQEILEQVRLTIRATAPEAKETISYKMPTFTLNSRYLVYFAAYKNHIGLYPAPIGVPESNFPAGLSRPARQALAAAGYDRLEQLVGASETDILKLHGMGPKGLDQLRRALAARGQSFADPSGE